jgi:hypothetical protein
MSVNVQVGIALTAVQARAASSASPLITTGHAIVLLPTPAKTVNMIVNVVGPVTGTNPKLVATLSEVDPADQTTVLEGQPMMSTGELTGVGTDSSVVLDDTASTVFRVDWTLTGSSPSFPVNITLIGKQA